MKTYELVVAMALVSMGMAAIGFVVGGCSREFASPRTASVKDGDDADSYEVKNTNDAGTVTLNITRGGIRGKLAHPHQVDVTFTPKSGDQIDQVTIEHDDPRRPVLHVTFKPTTDVSGPHPINVLIHSE